MDVKKPRFVMHMGILAMGYEYLRAPCAFIGIGARIRAKPGKAKGSQNL